MAESSATAYAAFVQPFIRGLAETGHTVGENVMTEYRWADGHYDRIQGMVDDLVEMAINLKTAKALGLTPSDNSLSLADEVIE